MIAVAAFLVITFASGAAQAHDAIDGAGPFVNGILHPFVEPAHVLLLVALGLWIGQQDRDTIRRAIIAFTVALLAGLLAGSLAILPPLVPLSAALIAGGLAASGWRAGARASAMIALFAAFLVGLDSAADDWAPGFGIWVGAELIVLNIVALIMRTRAPWQRTAVRIAGAWIAAIALLLLALAFRT